MPRRTVLLIALLLLLVVSGVVSADPPQDFLQFDGSGDNYVEVPGSGVPNSTDFSVSADGLTVAAWMRPDALTFTHIEGADPLNRFVHWLGKGRSREHEWTFRMYSLNEDCTDPRPTVCRRNRISFYLFNPGPPPLRGCGVAFQDDLEAGQWIHVVGVVDAANQVMHIYKNGGVPTPDGDLLPRTTFAYGGLITPTPGGAPLRMATRDFASFFQGALAQVRIWSRPLSGAEVHALFESNTVPPEGLVAEYLLDDGAGDRARDTAGTHDGDIYGALGWGFEADPVMNTNTGTNHAGC